MSVALTTRLKANVLKAVIDQVTGGNAELIERDSSIKIVLTQDQITWLQNFLDAQLTMKARPDIEIDVLGIIAPVILKKVWPFLAVFGGGAAALVIGALSKKKR
jgi:hypothetical protein